MPRRKRGSEALDKIQRRIAATQSIDPTLDLGNGLNVATYSALFAVTQKKLADYNTTLSTVDQIYQEVLEAERILSDYSQRMLSGICSKYGRSSKEYMMAGGRPAANRRRISSVAAAAAVTASPSPSAPILESVSESVLPAVPAPTTNGAASVSPA